MTRRRRLRPHRRGMDAQAVVETAIVIPILLALISVFLAIMVQVEVQQQMDAATKLAAESFFQAPQSAADWAQHVVPSRRAHPTRSTPQACRRAAGSPRRASTAP